MSATERATGDHYGHSRHDASWKSHASAGSSACAGCRVRAFSDLAEREWRIGGKNPPPANQGEVAAAGNSRPSSSTTILRARSTDTTRWLGMYSMLRSANAAISAFEVSGDGGTGLGSGLTSVMWQSDRTPRDSK